MTSKKNTPHYTIFDDESKGAVRDKWFCPVIDGEVKGHGLVPRDYRIHPPEMFDPPKDMQLIPRSEWSERIKEKEKHKSRLSDLRNFPVLDQNGQGYCLPPNSLVRMADGSLREIQHIRPGEFVVGYSGKPCRVNHTTQRLYTGDMLSLRVNGLEDPLILTTDHRVFTPNRKQNSPQHGDFYDSAACNFREGHEVFLGPRPGENVHNDLIRRVRSVGSRSVRDVLVCDIGVEREHAFVASGVLVHNCWSYSTTTAVMLTRAVMNQPMVRLSAHGPACKIKGWKNEGGWCGLSAKFQKEVGCPSVQFWPEKSMSKSHDKPETWANAALHKVTEDWIDLTRDVYDQNLSFDQLATALLSNVPCAVDFSWWGHSVCAMDLIEVESGSFGILIANSWGANWETDGCGILRGTKAIPVGAVALRVSGASPT